MLACLSCMHQVVQQHIEKHKPSSKHKPASTTDSVSAVVLPVGDSSSIGQVEALIASSSGNVSKSQSCLNTLPHPHALTMQQYIRCPVGNNGASGVFHAVIGTGETAGTQGL